MSRPYTKGTAPAAAAYWRARQTAGLMERIDQFGMPLLSLEARRAVRDAFEAGAEWERRHVRHLVNRSTVEVSDESV